MDISVINQNLVDIVNIDGLKKYDIHLDNLIMNEEFEIAIDTLNFKIQEIVIFFINPSNNTFLNIKEDITDFSIKEVYVPYFKGKSFDEIKDYVCSSNKFDDFTRDFNRFISFDYESNKSTYYNIINHESFGKRFDNNKNTGSFRYLDINQINEVCIETDIKNIIISNDIKNFGIYYKNNEVYKYTLYNKNLDIIGFIEKQIYEKIILRNNYQ